MLGAETVSVSLDVVYVDSAVKRSCRAVSGNSFGVTGLVSEQLLS